MASIVKTALVWLVLTLLVASGISGQDTADLAEARRVVERYEAALIAGDDSRLSEVRENNSLIDDIDFRRQLTPGALKVVSSRPTGVGVQDGMLYLDVYREFHDPNGKKVDVFGLNHIRIGLRRSSDGLLRVFQREHRDYWFGDQLVFAESSEIRMAKLKQSPEVDFREAIIRSAYRFRLTGDLDNSARSLDVCRSVARKFSDTAFLARCELNQALLYFSQGRNRQAMESLIDSEQLSLRSGDQLGYARALTAMGDIHESQGNPALARSMHERSLGVIRQAGISEPDARVTLNGIYMGLARSTLATGDSHQALKYLDLEANLGLRTLGTPDYSVMLLMAQIERLTGNTDLALRTFRDLERYARNRKPVDSEILVQSLIEIASIKLSTLNDPEAAETLADEAARRAQAADRAFLETQCLTILGNALSAQRRFTEAERAYRRAIDLIENRRSMMSGGVDAAARFLVNRLEPFSMLIELLINNGRFVEAFQFAERSKARVLADLMSGSGDQTFAATEEDTRMLSELQKALAKHNFLLIKEKQKVVPSTITLAELQVNLEKARLDLDDHRSRIGAKKLGGRLGARSFVPVDREQLTKLLTDEHSALIEYVLARDRAFAFVIKKSNGKLSLSAHTIDITEKELFAKVNTFRTKIQSADLDYRRDAADLYRILVRDWAEKLPEVRNLLIVPDSVLWDVPFQALVSSTDRFLIEDYIISYAPSLTVYSQMKEATKNSSFTAARLLAFGNPRIASSQIVQAENLRGGRLEPLPSAEKEVDTLASIFPAKSRKVVKGAGATESLFKADAKNYDVLHFATHGLLNGRNPMYSALLLSSSSYSTEDGLLEAWELAEMKLNAGLAVLSACETGRGHNAGEGLLGLTWAFFVSGVPRVVASQWKVESKSTSDLMKAFYRNLKADSVLSPPEALRKAMIHQINRNNRRHPFYWAGFIATGV